MRQTVSAIMGIAILAISYCVGGPVDAASPYAIALPANQAPPPASERAYFLLSPEDARLYKQIFSAQKGGDLAAADEAIVQLEDRRLLGHVLEQRYLHPTAYITAMNELVMWMKAYGDHPGAAKIYKLAQKKAKATGWKQAIPKPHTMKKIKSRLEPTMITAQPYHVQKGKGFYNKAFENKVIGQINRGQREDAVDAVFSGEKEGRIQAEQVDYLKSRIAAAYLYQGHVTMAHELAIQAFERSGSQVPLAGWVYGLTTWYNGNYKAATQGFESAAVSMYNSGWMRAASAFWAARSHQANGQPDQARRWLDKAQRYPRTFYGLLATFAARGEYSFDWEMPRLTREMVREMAGEASAMRALALMDAGRYHAAEQEFLYTQSPSPLVRHGMMALAQNYNMAELSMRLGGRVKSPKGGVFDAALYPNLKWRDMKPAYVGGDIDGDLIHAIIRQESLFNPFAHSKSGARGLMQLMPSTARYVADQKKIPFQGKKALGRPDYNIQLGQHYLQMLLDNPAVKGDVAALLIAYNAGPGNLKKWKKLWHDVRDPLLFIELIPSSETRTYVERVLANYWMYRIKNNRGMDVAMPLLQGEKLRYSLLTEDLPFALARSR